MGSTPTPGTSADRDRQCRSLSRFSADSPAASFQWLEAASGFRLLHGEAVGLGTLAACLLAERRGLPAFPDSLRRTLAQALLPLRSDLPSWEACRPWLLRDKKSAGTGEGAVHCILPRAGARAVVQRGVDLLGLSQVRQPITWYPAST